MNTSALKDLKKATSPIDSDSILASCKNAETVIHARPMLRAEAIVKTVLDNGI